MIVTDLDGTLLTDDKKITNIDQQALEDARKNGVITVMATGRNLHKINMVLSPDVPFDYAVVSSGAGVYNWGNKDYEQIIMFDYPTLESLCDFFVERDLSFFIFDKMPNNHHILYHKGRRKNVDFDAYLDFNIDYAKELNGRHLFENATQLMIPVANEGDQFGRLRDMLFETIEGIEVIRASSQLTADYTWMEIFPKKVSKGHGIDFLCKKYAIDQTEVIGIGNDYNDIEMLEYTGHSYVTDNAPAALKSNGYRVTASNQEAGVAKAIANHLSYIELQ